MRIILGEHSFEKAIILYVVYLSVSADWEEIKPFDLYEKSV
jgi:hypothetical protein